MYPTYLPIPLGNRDQAQPSEGIINFFLLCYQLKKTKRTGWVRRQVTDPESISDHMYLMSIILWVVISDSPEFSHVNKEKCIKMALVHDMAEAIVGDITPDDDICEQEKRELELEAMQTFCLSHFLGEQSHAAKEFLELWQEYEEDSTVEARLVKQVDKLEMALQAYVYERDQSANLDDFFASAKSKLHNEIFKDWLARVLKLREEVTRKGEKSNLE